MRVDGKTIAQEILESLSRQVILLKQKNITPHLAIILIGNDPASIAYVKQKILKANKVGIKTTLLNHESRIKPSPRAQAEGNQELVETIEQLNNDNNIHGIIIQRPLPLHINSELIDRAIDPQKDVDAFNSKAKFDSPISMAILAILEHVFERRGDTSEGLPTARTRYPKRILAEHWRDERVAGPQAEFINWLNAKKIAVIGKGETGGRPVIKTLKKLGVKPIIVDSKTQNSKFKTQEADIIISAVGKPKILNSSSIKKGAILISIGLHKGADGKLHGDYEEDEIKNTASFYTPTPGGVGPVNVSMLLKNVVHSAESFRC